ncbi:MAG: hypothetical protein ACP5II_04210 [Infirmifilum sp.]|uniref:hypothetical protein n=1 Tax=Infirmifilum sp. TaxID=2856575 RepID=UPI003D0EA837
MDVQAMLCREVYESLEPLSSKTRESRDFFGETVKMFEFGSQDHPPILLVSDFYGCPRATEVIADAVLRFTGDTHLFVVPCVFPSIAGGIKTLSRIMTGVELVDYDLFRESLLKQYKPIFDTEAQTVFILGNVVLVFTDEDEVGQLSEHLAKEYKDYLILGIRRDGSVKVLNVPGSEILTSPLEVLLRDLPEPLLTLYFSCRDADESCFIVSESYANVLAELSGLATSQLDEDMLCVEGSDEDRFTAGRGVKITTTLYERLSGRPAKVIEVSLGLKNYGEVSKSVIALLNASYILHALLR